MIYRNLDNDDGNDEGNEDNDYHNGDKDNDDLTWDYQNGVYKNNSDSDLFHWATKIGRHCDIVQYVGTGSNQNIAHSLGSVPKAIIIRPRDAVKIIVEILAIILEILILPLVKMQLIDITQLLGVGMKIVRLRLMIHYQLQQYLL